MDATDRAPRITIVIPARNDAAALGRTLDHLAAVGAIGRAEIVVAASGDVEGTGRAVRDCARLLWPDGSTRAELMNAGAAVARAPVLLFLHADSFPPADVIELIEQALADERVVGGAFAHRFAEARTSLRVISWMNWVRYQATRNYYGDQGLFGRAEIFRRLGGFAHLRVLEDLDSSRRLRRAGRTVLIRAPVVTSGRRFLARGACRTCALAAWILLLATLRLDTERFAERWRGPAGRAPGSLAAEWSTAPGSLAPRLRPAPVQC